MYDSGICVNTVRYDYYLLYIQQGCISVNRPVMDRSDMRRGDMVIFEACTPFSYIFKSESKEADTIYYWVHFTGYGAKEMILNCGLETNKIMSPGYHNFLAGKFCDIFNTFMIRDEFFDMDSSQCLVSLCIAFSRYISGSILNDVKLSNQRLHKSISYIHGNFNQPVSIKQLAGIEYLSVSRYCYVFNQIKNMSPQNYIIMLRLNNACELLHQTDLQIKDIAVAVGYCDQRYFNRIFKKRLGITPGEYRDSIENKPQVK
jgi:AraC-like DNA-binding protein